MNRLEYVLTLPDQTQPDAGTEALAAELRRDLIPLGVWVVVRRPDEASPGLHGICDATLQQRIYTIVQSIMTAHRTQFPSAQVH